MTSFSSCVHPESVGYSLFYGSASRQRRQHVSSQSPDLNICFGSAPVACFCFSLGFLGWSWFSPAASMPASSFFWALAEVLCVLMLVPSLFVYVCTCNLSFTNSPGRPWMSSFIWYFYSILQSFLGVSPVYVTCTVKYDNENVKGNMLSILFVSTENICCI